MPVELSDLAAPGTCAVLTQEIQRGVVGDLSSFPQLAEAARQVGVVPNTARLLAAARARNVPVVHCTAEFRPDRAGSTVNCSLIAAMVRNPEHLLVGTTPAELIAELGPEPGDLVSSRLHGVSPFTGTALDTWLRNLGVGTVVATGVSVNLGVLGLAIEAVNLGYRVVVPRDTVAGVPRAYADAVLDTTFPLISTLTTVDELVAAWDG
ncbi:MAG TPA: cysteine hydrolase [Acidimicrobiales bacterium]|jgi:nicotinamidase-related amidase|nr:cysteine hydrolase [Acidimicrobiales bacterium]